MQVWITAVRVRTRCSSSRYCNAVVAYCAAAPTYHARRTYQHVCVVLAYDTYQVVFSFHLVVLSMLGSITVSIAQSWAVEYEYGRRLVYSGHCRYWK